MTCSNEQIEKINNRPQDDFYMYVNKKWLEDPANAIPNEYSRWGGFVKLHDDGLKNQIRMVEELKTKQNRTDEENKIYAIWEASNSQFESWKNNNVTFNATFNASFDAISRELEILDAYFMPNQPFVDDSDMITRIAEYYYYSQMNGINNVFNFDKGSDLTNSDNVVMDISTCGLSLPSREYYLDNNFKEKIDAYRTHLVNVVKIINDGSMTYLDNDFVRNVMDFESELAKYKMTSDQRRSYNEYYTNTTLTNLYAQINDLTSLPKKQLNYIESERDIILNSNQLIDASLFFEQIYKLFNFREIMQSNHEKYLKNSTSNIEHITAYDGDGIRRVIMMILNPDNFGKYRSFLQYKIIKAYMPFCTKEIDEEFFNFYGKTLSGQVEQKPENKRSINIVNEYASDMMGKIYVEKYFSENHKNDVKLMISEILDAMKTSLNNNDWLTSETKLKALEKLEKFNVKIGYPDVWKDYSDFDIKIGDSLYDISKQARKWSIRTDFFEKINSVVDKNEWLMSPQEVNAYFMPTQNEIVFPAAILQPPFYCKTADDIDFDTADEALMVQNFDLNNYVLAANFGGIGAVIAHEITHGYDDKGKQFDGSGNLNDWWTSDDVDMFNAKTQLMTEQVEKYTFSVDNKVDNKVDNNVDNKEYKMNAQLTMGENLADLGGISLALQALKQKLKKDNIYRNSNMDYKIHYRMFFKSFANVWKSNAKSDHKIQALTTDPHAPCEFRANLVKNMAEFHDVFDVQENDPMYLPENKRVRMW